MIIPNTSTRWVPSPEIRLSILTITLFLTMPSAAIAQPTLEPCHAEWRRGDANGDLALNLADAVYLLKYLFQSGTPPPCLEFADFNEDSKITISDPAALLNYLFVGGKAPAQFWGEGANDPPKLYTDWPAQGGTAAIPNQLIVFDLSSESDIHKCQAVIYHPDHRETTIFQAEWPADDPDSSGMNLMLFPLQIFLDEADFQEKDFGKAHTLIVNCEDMQRYTNTLEIPFTPLSTNNADQKFNPWCYVYDDGRQDQCCQNQNGLYCRAYLRPEDTPPKCDKPEETRDFSDCCPNPSQCNWDQIQRENEGAGQGDADGESTGYKCIVKNLQIFYKDTDLAKIPPDTKKTIEEKLKDPNITGDFLGPTQTKGKIIADGKEYSLDRGTFNFIVLATLEEGSNPALCPEHQFSKFQFETTNKGWFWNTTEKFSIKLNHDPAFWDRDNIFKNVRLSDINDKLIDTPEEMYPRIVIVKHPGQGCSPDLKNLCDDTYGKPYLAKLHLPDQNSIVWFDAPGFGYTDFPSDPDPKTGIALKTSANSKTSYDFVDIVEDSPPIDAETKQGRWACSMLQITIERTGDDPAAPYNINGPIVCGCSHQIWTGVNWVKDQNKNCQ